MTGYLLCAKERTVGLLALTAPGSLALIVGADPDDMRILKG